MNKFAGNYSRDQGNNRGGYDRPPNRDYNNRGGGGFMSRDRGDNNRFDYRVSKAYIWSCVFLSVHSKIASNSSLILCLFLWSV